MNKNYNEKLSVLKSNGKIKKLYDLYDQNNNLKEKNAFNVFNILNLRENSHTSLIKWLLKNREEFKNKFFKLLGIEGIDNANLEFLKSSFKDEENNKNYFMDCIFTFKKNNKDCVCVIESKLDAKLCIIDKETQIERYCKHLKEKYSEYTKYFVYLCPDCGKLNKLNKEIKIGNNEQGNFTTFEVIEKLKKNFENITFLKIEFSDIILMLFDILYDNKSENRISCSCTNEDVKHLINLLSNKPIIKRFMSNFNTENGINYTMENLRENYKYKKPQRYNIKLEDILTNMDDDKVKKLLSQYIEYWEDWAPFIDGYTKIINGVFLYDIMKSL